MWIPICQRLPPSSLSRRPPPHPLLQPRAAPHSTDSEGLTSSCGRGLPPSGLPQSPNYFSEFFEGGRVLRNKKFFFSITTRLPLLPEEPTGQP